MPLRSTYGAASARAWKPGVRGLEATPSLPVMTSDSAPAGYTAFGSALFAGDYYKAFDGNFNNGYTSFNFGPGNFGRSYPTAIVVGQFSIVPQFDNVNAGMLTWDFQGSNNGSAWTTIQSYTVAGGSGWTAGVERIFPVTNLANAYLYHRISCNTSYNWGGGGQWGVSEVRFWKYFR